MLGWTQLIFPSIKPRRDIVKCLAEVVEDEVVEEVEADMVVVEVLQSSKESFLYKIVLGRAFLIIQSCKRWGLTDLVAHHDLVVAGLTW
jgi:hypothetical protein